MAMDLGPRPWTFGLVLTCLATDSSWLCPPMKNRPCRAAHGKAVAMRLPPYREEKSITVKKKGKMGSSPNVFVKKFNKIIKYNETNLRTCWCVTMLLILFAATEAQSGFEEWVCPGNCGKTIRARGSDDKSMKYFKQSKRRHRRGRDADSGRLPGCPKYQGNT